MQQQLIYKHENQSVFDVLLQHAGAISGLFEFLNDNQLSSLDVPEGEYFAPAVVNQTIVSVLNTSSQQEVPVIATNSIANNYEVTVTLNGNPFNVYYAGTTQHLTIKDEQGTELPTTINGNDIVIPISSDWQRPRYWPVLENMQRGIYYLIEHFQNTSQWLNWWCDQPTDLYVDGNFIKTLASSVYHYEEFKEEELGFYHQGKKYSWIFMDIRGENPLISHHTNATTYNPRRNKGINILEEYVNVERLKRYTHSLLGSYSFRKATKHLWFHPNIEIENCIYLFRGNNLEHITNFPVLSSVCEHLFNQALYVPSQLDFTNVMNAMNVSTTINNSKMYEMNIVNAQNCTNISSFANGFQSLISVRFDNLNNVSNAFNAFLNCTSLQRVELNELRVSTSFQNCYSLNKSSLLLLIESIADMTGYASPTLNLIGVPDNNAPEVIAAAQNKNWTIIR